MAGMEGMGYVLDVGWRASPGLSMESLDELARLCLIYAGFALALRSAVMAASRSDGSVEGA